MHIFLIICAFIPAYIRTHISYIHVHMPVYICHMRSYIHKRMLFYHKGPNFGYIAASSVAMNAVANNANAMNYIVNSSTARESLYNNSSITQSILANSQIAIDAMINSSQCDTKQKSGGKISSGGNTNSLIQNTKIFAIDTWTDFTRDYEYSIYIGDDDEYPYTNNEKITIRSKTTSSLCRFCTNVQIHYTSSASHYLRYFKI